MSITKVGIGIAIFRANPETVNRQVLMGKRKGSHGEGEWSFPGGHLDYMESFVETALREIEEEVGPQFKVVDLQFVSLINMQEYASKHFVDIGLCAWHESGDPVVMEPEKCESWGWDVTNIPSPRFATIDRILYSALNIDLDGIAVWDKE